MTDKYKNILYNRLIFCNYNILFNLAVLFSLTVLFVLLYLTRSFKILIPCMKIMFKSGFRFKLIRTFASVFG